MDDKTDFGDCVACRELLMKIEADLAEYERELAMRQPSLTVQVIAGFCMASTALAIAWFIA